MPEVAEFFGVSPTAVQRDWRRQGMPGENGRYPLNEIAKWKIQRERDQNRPKISDEQKSLRERLDEAEVLKAEFDARLKELKVAEAEGRLIDKETAIAEIEEMFHRVRARLEQIPQELGTTIPPEIRADLIADMRHKLQLVLREMEGWADV